MAAASLPCPFRYAHYYDYVSVPFQSLLLSHVPTPPLVLFNLTQTQSWWTWQSVESNEASHFVANWWGSCDIHTGQKHSGSKQNGTNTRISFSHSLFYSLVFMICHNFRNWQPWELRTANIYHFMQLHRRNDRKIYCVEKKLYFVCNIMKDNKVKVKIKQSR